MEGPAPGALSPGTALKGRPLRCDQWWVVEECGQVSRPCKVGKHAAPEVFRTPSCRDEQGVGFCVLMTVEGEAIFMP